MRCWLLAIVLFVGCLTALEMHLRRHGHHPSVNDDSALWSQMRHKLDRADTSKMVAVLGASRAQMGFDPDVFADETDMEVVQLSIDGRNFMPVLKDIAETTDFAGLAVCSFRPELVFWQDEPASESQQGWVDRYHDVYGGLAWVEKSVNRSLASMLQSKLVIANTSTEKLLRNRFTPKPASYLTMKPNRHRPANYYTLMTAEQRAADRSRRIRQVEADTGHRADPGPIDGWRQRLGEIAGWVKKIESRGGRVVFVRYPTTDEHWQYDQQRYPKEAFWDTIDDLTGIETLHFTEVTELEAFDCPDTSHMSFDHAQLFTHDLATRLLGPAAEAD